jgi:hypothetical protein
MERCPTIGSEFIDTVEQMRKVQIEHAELAGGRDGHNQRFALTRVGQRKKALEKRVDAMLVQYHADLKKWLGFTGEKKHSEEQATYEVKTESGE